METTQLSIDRWISKENVVCTYKRILFSLIKEGNSSICDRTDEPGGHYAKWKKLLTEQLPHDFTYMRL